MSFKSKVDEAVKTVDFKKNQYQLVLETSEGTIRLNLDPEVAPGHCKNMIGLA